ncbi:MAG: hydantoinase/carbamoylase family amidase [Actinobacteria bacterium]|uniref:Unannotated protein n=1 Tax=freshwater metagenome TaxID=449393 RepID=A0A6J5YPI9_9ZZZZ|nr:hydantoinase/carbamoylase family amidase [Actinomycetota bacterium]
MSLTIDSDRLWRSLNEISNFGQTSNGGLHRLAATPEDGQARDYFASIAASIGCTIRIDALGNLFVRRAGADNSNPAILIGSHLDSQPLGGKYDGVYGVMAGLEVLRTLHDNNHQTSTSVEVVCWTNEEGARFAPAMMGASYFAGKYSADELHDRIDTDGVSLKSSLADIGYLGTDHVQTEDFGAYLEIHIEQGPTLELENIPIGVVTGVQAMRWHRVHISGVSGHSGTYPLELRKDALVAAARIVESVNQIGLRRPHIARATVGFLHVSPNSPNVIPGSVELMVEFRHPEMAVLDEMSEELLESLTLVTQTTGTTFEVTQELNSPPVVFDTQLLAHVEAASQTSGLASKRMLSGAGHDACQVASLMPSAMIFIPCVDGISHAENESITAQWAAQGAQVLLETVLRIDS